MMKILVTGFDPFGSESVNPAYEAVKLLPDVIAGAQLIKLEIPTIFTKSIQVVKDAVKTHHPDMVINVGQAGGPVAYFSTLPVTKMVQNVKAHDLPCEISYSAGTYVCNSIMYRVLHLASKEYPNMKAGFIHVPYSCEQAAKKNGYVASMPLETIAKSLEYAIAAAIS